MAIAIFRVFQEALTNTSKHASASQVQVTLADFDQLILLEVGDNGKGITEIDLRKRDSFGIRGMRERCQQLKGSFHIVGNPGEGTKVTIIIPKGDYELPEKETTDPEVEKDHALIKRRSRAFE